MDKASYSLSETDLKSTDVEAPIRDTRSIDCRRLAGHFERAAKAAQEKKIATTVSVYSLLAQILQIHFKPSDRAEPYGPMYVADGRRTIVPTDLCGSQSATLASFAPSINNLGLRARCADIAWICDRKLASMAVLAIRGYCDGLAKVLSGDAELFAEDEKASSHHGEELLRRACQIATATGWKEPEAGLIAALTQDVLQDALRRNDENGFLNFSELALDYRLVPAATIASNSERMAASGGFPDTSRRLWEVAARAHRHDKNETEGNRCLVNAAECYVAMAAAADFKGMTAASWLMDAIKALRHLSGTGPRRAELEAKLREAQASISDQMGVFSTEIDLSEIVDDTRKRIGGLSLAEAIAEFIQLERSPAPDKLREDYLKQANENPLINLIPMTIHDDEGKVVSQSPGLMSGKEDEEVAIRHGIARHEDFRRQFVASGAIEPARRTIMAEHPLSLVHFGPLVQMSPFIPSERREIFVYGFHRFFGGDYISALHILIPQLENSLRHVLKQVAADPSAIKKDMTQENSTISIMLDRDRERLESILGAALVFEIDNLFDFRGGPSLRHGLAHGLLSDSALHGHDAIYACWFIFRLCCLPLLRHWQSVTDAYATFD